MPMFLILLSSLTSTAEGVCVRRYNTRHSEGGFLFTAMISLFSLVFFVLTNSGGFSMPPLLWLYGILSGVFYCSASLWTYKALQTGPFAEINLIISYSVIMPIVYGVVFLHEPVSVRTIPGIAAILYSVFLMKPDMNGEAKAGSGKWLLLTILSSVGNGMIGILQKGQQLVYLGECDHEFMIITLGLSFMVLASIGLWQTRRGAVGVALNGLPYAALAGFSNGATNLMSLLTLQMISISLASPLRMGMKILFSCLCSRLLYKESISKKQAAGILIGTLGVILLNI